MLLSKWWVHATLIWEGPDHNFVYKQSWHNLPVPEVSTHSSATTPMQVL